MRLYKNAIPHAICAKRQNQSVVTSQRANRNKTGQTQRLGVIKSFEIKKIIFEDDTIVNREPVKPHKIGPGMAGTIMFENKPTEGILNLSELSCTGLVESTKKGIEVIKSAANQSIA